MALGMAALLMLAVSGAQAQSGQAKGTYWHDKPHTGLLFTVEDTRDLPDYQIDGRCEPIAETPTGPGGAWQPGDGRCTLRAALDEINAAGGSGHFIAIPPMTIWLDKRWWWRSGMRVAPGVGVTIGGAGVSRSVIDGVNLQRILEVDAGASVRLRGMTLTWGHDYYRGGAIRNSGNVHISDSLFDSNHASSMFGAWGGAIFNEATGVLTIVNTTFSRNQARNQAGAIYNFGYLVVTDSTFTRNSTVFTGGAIENSGTAWIGNSTFSSNGMGAITNVLATGRTFVYNTTIANSSAPPLQIVRYPHTDVPGPQAIFALFNTIVQGGNDPNCDTGSYGLPIRSFGFNLSSDFSCGFTQRGDQQGVDPLLGPLADNGGPTQTHRLLPGSPAIDEGFCWGADQRWRHRPSRTIPGRHAGNGCDIGAFELQRYEVQ